MKGNSPLSLKAVTADKNRYDTPLLKIVIDDIFMILDSPQSLTSVPLSTAILSNPCTSLQITSSASFAPTMPFPSVTSIGDHSKPDVSCAKIQDISSVSDSRAEKRLTKKRKYSFIRYRHKWDLPEDAVSLRHPIGTGTLVLNCIRIDCEATRCLNPSKRSNHLTFSATRYPLFWFCRSGRCIRRIPRPGGVKVPPEEGKEPD